MRLLALFVVATLTGCPSHKEPPPPAVESPKFVKDYKRKMDSAKTDVEAAEKREEQRDDKLYEQAK